MQDYFLDLFGSYGRIIVFLHVVSASLLIGSMFMVRFVIKPVLMGLEDEHMRYKKCLKLTDTYSYYIFAIMIVVVSASFLMRVGLGFEYASPTLYSLIHVKEAIWLFMALNFVYMHQKFRNAKKAFKTREFFEVHENLNLIVTFLIPLNLVLALIAVYLGIIIRGF